MPIKTENVEKMNNVAKNGDFGFVDTLLITPDMLRMLMERNRHQKPLYFEAVVVRWIDNCLRLIKK
ncbi:hypothetical protein DESC_810183 [Desulfosarcina cetonica]|nr:hypothetical protein DESC_810183 [Desulfosarcina cetonica]